MYNAPAAVYGYPVAGWAARNGPATLGTAQDRAKPGPPHDISAAFTGFRHAFCCVFGVTIHKKYKKYKGNNSCEGVTWRA